MEESRTPPKIRELDKYLIRGEEIVTFEHHHIAKLTRPILFTLGATILALWLDATVPSTASQTMRVVWFIWLGVVAYMVFQLIEWRRDWFVATNKRLLLFHGIPRQVAMMPLIKVTDMTYDRSVPGLILRYGRFIMESAGQDQALSEINFVPRPIENYQLICAEIFGYDTEDDDYEQWRQQLKVQPPSGPTATNDPTLRDPRQAQIDWDGTDQDAPHAIPLRGRPTETPQSIYTSPDLVQRRRKADTGPIPIRDRRRDD